MGEEIIIQDENGKKYSVLRVLDADTKKIIDDLSALVVKKDKIIDLMLETLIGLDSDVKIVKQMASINTKEKKEHLLKIYEKRCNNAKD